MHWQNPFQITDYYNGTPAVGPDGTVYVGWDKLYAIDPGTGVQKWAISPPAGYAYWTTPTIGPDGNIYVSGGFSLYVYNSKGQLQWTSTGGGGPLAIGKDGTVYEGGDDAIYVLSSSPSSQSPLVTLKYSGPNQPSVSALTISTDGGTLYACGLNSLYAINLNNFPTPYQKWRFDAGCDLSDTPAIGPDGTIYVGSGDYNLYAINPDGSKKWTFLTTGDVESSPAVGSDGTVYVGSDDGKLYAINPNGTIKWSVTTGNIIQSSPAIGADGTVYVGSDDHNLYAVGPGVGSTAPTVAITSPSTSPYSTNNPSLSIAGTASAYSSRSITSVSWSSNQGASGGCTGTANWSTSGISLTIGQNIITVTATDSSGQTGTAVLIVTYAPAPPTISITSPVAVTPPSTGTYSTSANTLSIAGSASPGSGYSLTGVSWTSNQGGSGTCTGTTSWSADNIALSIGTNVITITATDNRGQTANAVLTVTYTPSATPTVSITSPVVVTPPLTGTYSTSANTLSIAGSASPGSGYGLTGVSWTNSQGGSGTCTGTTSWSAGNILLNPGQNVITITATDSHAQTANAVLTVTYSLPATPTITITSPAIATPGFPGVYSTSQNTLSISGVAAPGNGYSLTGVTWINDPYANYLLSTTGNSEQGVSGTCTGTSSWSANNLTLSPGVNNIFVTATDSSSQTITACLHVTYTPPAAPTVTITSPTLSQTYSTGSQTVSLAGTASAGDAIESISWTNSRGGSGVCTGTTTWNTCNITVPQGRNLITLTATDSLGQTGKTTLMVYSSMPAPWQSFGRDARHAGLSPFKGPDNPNHYSWNTTGDRIYSSPAIDLDGTVYVGSDDGNLYAFNASGYKKWAFQIGSSAYYNSPAIGLDRTVYFGAGYSLYAIDPNSGIPKWTFATGGDVTSPTIGPDGTIYIGSQDHNLYAVSPNGAEKWAFYNNAYNGAYTCDSPAVGSDGTVYVPSSCGWLYALNPNGTQKWVYCTVYINIPMMRNTTYALSSPAIGSDGTIYVGSIDGCLWAIDHTTGQSKWAVDFNPEPAIPPHPIYAAPSIGPDDTMYVCAGDSLYALDSNSGTQKWSYRNGNPLYASPAIGQDGTVYLSSLDSNLYAFNHDGSQKWAFKTGNYLCSSPAIAPNGTIYVGSCDNNLYAIGPGPKNILLAGLTSGGNILYTSDMDTWQSVPGTMSSIGIGDFNLQNTFGIAALSSSGNVYYTNDLQNWNTFPGVLSSLAVGNFAQKGQDYIAGLASNQTIWYTTNMASWANIPGYLTTLVSGDFNGDGKCELAGLSYNNEVWYTTDMADWYQIPGYLSTLIAGDFNGDGKDELAGTAPNGEIWYTTDMADWTYVPGAYSHLAAGDFTGSGKAGLAGLDSNGTVYYTTDMQNWTGIPGVALTSIVVSDFNRDGVADIAGLDSSGNVWYTTDLYTWTELPGATLASLSVPRR
jgi:outer membrane protein assembly factor BamB